MTASPSEDRLTESARYHDYRYASNPISDGTLGGVPAARWGADLHELGPTRTLPLDSSASLGVIGPATTPGLCANFVHIGPSEAHATEAIATTHLFFVMRGGGSTRLADGTEVPWHAGDLFTLPAGGRATHAATEDAALYWVHDAPLLRYLGVEPRQPMFPPTVYRRTAILEALDAVVRDPSSANANRLSVLLGNRLFPQTMTITHVMWAMFGLLPVGAVQAPAPPSVGGGRSRGRLQAGLLHDGGQVARQGRSRGRRSPVRLAPACGVRDAAGALAFPPQRVGPPGARPADPGCGPAHLPADARHPVFPRA